MKDHRGSAMKLAWLCHPLIFGLVHYSDAQASFANVTLYSPNGELSALIFLPKGLKPDEPTYYLASRFDHSSMIGNIRRTIRNSNPDGSPNTKSKSSTTHLLYGTEQWRAPHDPYWPESGVGLAAEFGVGDDGGFCSYRCGWDQVNEVTNGVLGYEEAKDGESFLKIGVGELVKGSCPTCDSSGDYKFNSPYEFKHRPEWQLETNGDRPNTMSLSHEATLNQYGYRLRKEMVVNDDVIQVKTTLTNLGRVPFATAWYSHHFYTCDNHPIGRGVSVDLDLAATGGAYDEPGTWFWSTPIANYASITPSEENVSVKMQRGVEQGVRIKAEFIKDEESHGDFTIHGCETRMTETIPEMKTSHPDISMYAFNLYIETGTFSPEPQIFMHLWPGQTTSWTQRLDFQDLDETTTPASVAVQEYGMADMTWDDKKLRRLFDRDVVAFASIVVFMTVVIQALWKRRTTTLPGYSSIPDHPVQHIDQTNESSTSTAEMDLSHHSRKNSDGR